MAVRTEVILLVFFSLAFVHAVNYNHHRTSHRITPDSPFLLQSNNANKTILRREPLFTIPPRDPAYDIVESPPRLLEAMKEPDWGSLYAMQAVLAQYHTSGFGKAEVGRGLYVTDKDILRARLHAATVHDCRAVKESGTVLVVSVVVRHGARYLQEWLTYYIRLGVSHFLIYFNQDTLEEDASDKAIAPFLDDWVTPIMWPTPTWAEDYHSEEQFTRRQQIKEGTIQVERAHTHALKLLKKKWCSYTEGSINAAPDCDDSDPSFAPKHRIWWAHLELDEFLTITNENLCIPDILGHYNSIKHAGGVVAGVKPFTGSNLLLEPQSFVISSFTERAIPVLNVSAQAEKRNPFKYPLYKIFVNVERVAAYYGNEKPEMVEYTKPSFVTMNGNTGATIHLNQPRLVPDPPKDQHEDQWAVNHYACRSLEAMLWEWVKGRPEIGFQLGRLEHMLDRYYLAPNVLDTSALGAVPFLQKILLGIVL